MESAAFDQAINYLIVNEGLDYTNNPLDSGGPTKFGVTQKAYQGYVKRMVDVNEMKSLTIDEAKRFYFDSYWVPLLCERITAPSIAICIFDTGVLYGVKTAATLAQKAVSMNGAVLKIDGILGDKSIEFINLIAPETFIESFHGFLLLRIGDIVSGSPKNEVFRRGWTNRANRLLTLSDIAPVIKT